ncbi:hypothetical protein [Streptomyces noursei]|uniref:hypothetical protein n=1 Tax=Streptomyces noursei TaxID=1971 RepID=UPI00167A4273|nr:hypothetical protein [Streptomyces noursei]MCZ1014022.1 hypothetical protein [Streptomyces noursei]GGX49244.1 hypothetical protein GCM10010341_83620 [Streptomyces noursei]
MTPMERLLAEELPTGTFGDAQQRGSAGKPRRVSSISAIQAAANRRALEEAISDQRKRKPRRVLHLVPTDRSAA